MKNNFTPMEMDMTAQAVSSELASVEFPVRQGICGKVRQRIRVRFISLTAG